MQASGDCGLHFYRHPCPADFFPLQTLSCPIRILHASFSQDSYDLKKLSEIFVEQNNTPNRGDGS